MYIHNNKDDSSIISARSVESIENESSPDDETIVNKPDDDEPESPTYSEVLRRSSHERRRAPKLIPSF